MVKEPGNWYQGISNVGSRRGAAPVPTTTSLPVIDLKQSHEAAEVIVSLESLEEGGKILAERLTHSLYTIKLTVRNAVVGNSVDDSSTLVTLTKESLQNELALEDTSIYPISGSWRWPHLFKGFEVGRYFSKRAANDINVVVQFTAGLCQLLVGAGLLYIGLSSCLVDD
ncbi:hypothetical protein PR048_032506 [Dryococelus australis]|uniref:Uncharacterized protein n=1 Tax=Dryococelus australis TaxID=614101 RepID=A0ABQ9G2E5_9NEOP|nr:hypothetical protein PR048_032506 [Dryococelus australis]